MNKKIMIIVLSLFGCLFIVATVLFISNKNEENSGIIEEPKEIIEPQNSNQYVKIDDANLSSTKADVHILIKYSLGLYAKATDNYEIEGDILVNYGNISKLTNKDNIPINELETNSKEFLNAFIVRYSYDELVIQKDDDVYKFYRIGD